MVLMCSVNKTGPRDGVIRIAGLFYIRMSESAAVHAFIS